MGDLLLAMWGAASDIYRVYGRSIQYWACCNQEKKENYKPGGGAIILHSFEGTHYVPGFIEVCWKPLDNLP